MVEEGWKKGQKMGINNNNCLAALGQVTPFPGPSGVWENMFHSFYFTQAVANSSFHESVFP